MIKATRGREAVITIYTTVQGLHGLCNCNDVWGGALLF